MRKYFFSEKLTEGILYRKSGKLTFCVHGASWKPDSMALMSQKNFPVMACHALYKHLQHSQAAKLKPFV